MTTQLKPRPTETQVTEAPQQAPERTAPAKRKTRRTGRWIVALAMVAAVGIVALDAVTGEPVATAPDNVPAFDSPGGNSLNIPAKGTAADGWPFESQFNSPGGNSLKLP